MGENEKSDNCMKKKSNFFSYISLLLERGQNDEEGAFYKLDLLSNNNLNVESFYQNLLHFIYLKSRFLMMVIFINEYPYKLNIYKKINFHLGKKRGAVMRRKDFKIKSKHHFLFKNYLLQDLHIRIDYFNRNSIQS